LQYPVKAGCCCQLAGSDNCYMSVNLSINAYYFFFGPKASVIFPSPSSSDFIQAFFMVQRLLFFQTEERSDINIHHSMFDVHPF
jgi:hypothetical protein